MWICTLKCNMSNLNFTTRYICMRVSFWLRYEYESLICAVSEVKRKQGVFRTREIRA